MVLKRDGPLIPRLQFMKVLYPVTRQDCAVEQLLNALRAVKRIAGDIFCVLQSASFIDCVHEDTEEFIVI